MRSRPNARLRFAARLRAVRETNFPTQKEFADRCGFQPETYRMWERGDREPNITNLRKIATTLNISLDYLIVGRTPIPVSVEDVDIRVIRRARRIGKQLIVVRRREAKSSEGTIAKDGLTK